MSENEKEQVCAVCNVPTTKMCNGCKIVSYCSREHQTSDWKSHSKSCGASKMVVNSVFGRHNVAARDIKIDEIVIFEKKPLLVTPDLGSGPLCLSCYEPIRFSGARPCENCGWPLCRDCTKHGPECEITLKYRKKKIIINDDTCPFRIYDTICALRALALRNEKPEDYKKILDLEDHGAKMPMSIYNFVANTMVEFMGIDDVDEAEIVKIMGAVRINAFGIRTPKNHHYGVLFEKASYNAHSCRPNCYGDAYYDAKTGARLIMRALTTIRKGDPITISYVNDLWGTVQRRRILRETKMFECKCERCSDPTEFGTMYNAVKCRQIKCTDGYMLPPTFLVSGDTPVPDYACDKCKSTMSSSIIDNMIETISMKFERINASSEKELKRFIDEQSKNLHKNHFHIVNAELKLIFLFDQRNDNEKSAVSENFLREHIALCQKLDSLLKIIAPGENITRAMILVSQFNRTCSISNFSRSDCMPEAFKECKEAITEVYRLTRYEPNDEEGGQLAKLAQFNLEWLNKIEERFA